MTPKNIANTNYFNWMVSIVCGNRYSSNISYIKLLTCLHDVRFVCVIPRDKNRAEDGIDLRRRYVILNNCEEELDYLNGRCSVLEMMIALAIRCEESIMDDPRIGDRTGQWFWGMINNLGLGSMTDNRFDEVFVLDTIDRFIKREYEPNGKGGLFTINGCKKDLRKVEIWYQLCWYLDSIT